MKPMNVPSVERCLKELEAIGRGVTSVGRTCARSAKGIESSKYWLPVSRARGRLTSCA